MANFTPLPGSLTDWVLTGGNPEDRDALAALALPASSASAPFERLERPDAMRLVNVSAGLDRLAQARAFAQARRIDFEAVPAGLSIRNYRLAVFDMDSTLIANECIDELADIAGCGDAVAAITRAAMEGHLPFAKNLERRVALLEGLPRSAVDKVIGRIRLHPGVEAWMAFLKRHGVAAYIFSGGFAEIAGVLARRLDMAGFVCNRLEWDDGVLTGRVTGPAGGKILDADGKRRALEVAAELAGMPLSAAIAAGDGANDLQMIEAAGFGFAYHGKAVVTATAPFAVRFGGFEAAQNWFIESWREDGAA